MQPKLFPKFIAQFLSAGKQLLLSIRFIIKIKEMFAYQQIFLQKICLLLHVHSHAVFDVIFAFVDDIPATCRQRRKS